MTFEFQTQSVPERIDGLDPHLADELKQTDRVKSP
jgi:hypothetical protein